jgi:hypothetical protein
MLLARSSSSLEQWRAFPAHRHGGAGASQVSEMVWLLAQEGRMTDNPHTVTAVTANALIVKRADILFEISQAEKRIDALRAELVHVNAVLRMFRPDADLDTLPTRFRRPTRSPYFGHGEITQRVYDAIREGTVITSVDVAIAAMRAKGLDPDTDLITRKEFTKLIRRALTDMAQDGKIERASNGRPARWRIKS